MKQPVLDLYALQTFVLGIELGSFALAAKRQNKSTSAVSAQLKKLEQQTNTVLVNKSGRYLVPTEQGEQLLSYAKKMLALNDEAVATLNRSQLRGQIHLGVQEDFAEPILTQSLSRFIHLNREVQLHTVVDRYAALLSSLRSGELDVAVTWQGTEPFPDAECIGETPMHWIASPDFDLRPFLAGQQPLPLVVVEPHCLFKQKALAALEAQGIRWQVVYQSQSLSGIWPAVHAGLGITVRTAIGCPQRLAIVAEGLPAPGRIGINMHRSQATPLAERMMSLIKESFTA